MPLLAATFLLASGAAHANTRPTISGTPSTTVKVKSWYSFLPTGSDKESPASALRYSVANKPAWAEFSTISGRLNGAPQTAGTWSNIRITVRDQGGLTATLPAFSITAVAPTANRPPVISGTPGTAVNAGSSYSFRPTASDPDGDPLGFSIQNRPAWATFNTATGQLSGTPGSTHVGSYSNIRISVSDGRTSAALPAFTIAVRALSSTSTAPGTASLSWSAPLYRTNGATLTNLAGYRIHYGRSATVMPMTIQVNNPSISTYVLQSLPPGTYYFAVRAIDSQGQQSVLSNVTSTTVK